MVIYCAVVLGRSYIPRHIYIVSTPREVVFLLSNAMKAQVITVRRHIDRARRDIEAREHISDRLLSELLSMVWTSSLTLLVECADLGRGSAVAVCCVSITRHVMDFRACLMDVPDFKRNDTFFHDDSINVEV